MENTPDLKLILARIRRNDENSVAAAKEFMESSEFQKNQDKVVPLILESPFALKNFSKETNTVRHVLLEAVRKVPGCFFLSLPMIGDLLSKSSVIKDFSAIHAALSCIHAIIRKDTFFSAQKLETMFPSLEKIGSECLGLFFSKQVKPISEQGAIYGEILRLCCKIMKFMDAILFIEYFMGNFKKLTSFCFRILEIPLPDLKKEDLRFKEDTVNPPMIWWSLKKTAIQVVDIFYDHMSTKSQISVSKPQDELVQILLTTVKETPSPLDSFDKLKFCGLTLLMKLSKTTSLEPFIESIFQYGLPFLIFQNDEKSVDGGKLHGKEEMFPLRTRMYRYFGDQKGNPRIAKIASNFVKKTIMDPAESADRKQVALEMLPKLDLTKKNKDLVPVFTNHVFEKYLIPMLSGDDAWLRVRACFLLGELSGGEGFQTINRDLWTIVFQKMIRLLKDPIPFLRPVALVQITPFIIHFREDKKIMLEIIEEYSDEILAILKNNYSDFHRLWTPVHLIVNIIGEEIAPYAVKICKTLIEVFKLICPTAIVEQKEAKKVEQKEENNFFTDIMEKGEENEEEDEDEDEIELGDENYEVDSAEGEMEFEDEFIIDEREGLEEPISAITTIIDNIGRITDIFDKVSDLLETDLFAKYSFHNPRNIKHIEEIFELLDIITASDFEHREGMWKIFPSLFIAHTTPAYLEPVITNYVVGGTSIFLQNIDNVKTLSHYCIYSFDPRGLSTSSVGIEILQSALFCSYALRVTTELTPEQEQSTRFIFEQIPEYLKELLPLLRETEEGTAERRGVMRLFYCCFINNPNITWNFLKTNETAEWKQFFDELMKTLGTFKIFQYKRLEIIGLTIMITFHKLLPQYLQEKVPAILKFLLAAIQQFELQLEQIDTGVYKFEDEEGDVVEEGRDPEADQPLITAILGKFDEIVAFSNVLQNDPTNLVYFQSLLNNEELKIFNEYLAEAEIRKAPTSLLHRCMWLIANNPEEFAPKMKRVPQDLKYLMKKFIVRRHIDTTLDLNC